eukprot:TRINITY_DN3352_c0_g1_i6.p2 TRINITY_DN3352_c0_g1~~TRINITY_DN3352_c0_g1_i6.p2  ORF type:complete len:160 (-),score=29.65 TRINITY_DN3352_c0_g1_i6:102-581(-)
MPTQLKTKNPSLSKTGWYVSLALVGSAVLGLVTLTASTRARVSLSEMMMYNPRQVMPFAELKTFLDAPDNAFWAPLTDAERRLVSPTDDCAICLSPLVPTQLPPGTGDVELQALSAESVTVVRLRACQGHLFHHGCIKPCVQPNGHLDCPLCKTAYSLS